MSGLLEFPNSEVQYSGPRPQMSDNQQGRAAELPVYTNQRQ